MTDPIAANIRAAGVNAGYIDRVLAGTPYAARVAPYTAHIRAQAGTALGLLPSAPTVADPAPAAPASGAPAPGQPVVVPDSPVMGPAGIPLTCPPELDAEYAREYAVFQPAEAAAVAAAGKPVGGALTPEESLALAESLGLPLIVNQCLNAKAGLPMTVSPQPGGASLQSIYDAAAAAGIV